jgi:hypothetical protein
MKSNKYLIGLAGEMRVCSELLARGHFASITFGNAKATDILITGKNNRFLRVEVKTSKNNRNFVTGYYPKYTQNNREHPDVWIFYLPNNDASSSGERFFIATHKEVGTLQLQVNKGVKTKAGKGYDNIPLKLLQQKQVTFEDRWDLIDKLLKKL